MPAGHGGFLRASFLNTDDVLEQYDGFLDLPVCSIGLAHDLGTFPSIPSAKAFAGLEAGNGATTFPSKFRATECLVKGLHGLDGRNLQYLPG
jgi:hypothetical protein